MFPDPRPHIHSPGHETKNNPRDKKPKRVKPVHGPHTHDFHERVKQVQGHFQRLPGVTPFVRQHGGAGVTGDSGIVSYHHIENGTILRSRK